VSPADCEAVATAHYVEKCSCGRVIGQCRCHAQDKDVRVTPGGCPECRGDVPTFPAEVEAGLAEAVRAGGRLRVTAAARPDPAAALPDVVVAHLRAVAGTDLSKPDLYPLRARLVTTTLNDNDDWFDAADTWAARATPEDKPFNFEHEAADVIGHMTGAVVVDAAGVAVSGAEPPPFFHIDFPAVLYRHWPGYPDKQERMDRIIAALDGQSPDDQWFVSMEVRFKGFDYVLIPREGGDLAMAKAKVVPRQDDTAFLTKHLRLYGGSGEYQGYRVGRALKNKTFSGVALVREPANKPSVILAAGTAAAAAGGKNSGEISPPGYQPHSTASADRTTESAMTIEVLQKQVEELKAELAAAKTAETTKQTTELQGQLDAAKAGLSAAEAAKAEADKAIAALTARAEAAEAAKAAAEKLLADAEAAKVLAERVGQVKDAYGFESTDEAKATTETLAALTAEAFAKHLEIMKAYKAKSVPAPKVAPPATVAAATAGATVVPETVAVVTTAAADDEASAVAAEMLAFYGKAELPEGEDAPKPKAKK
jgi:hypothetical protein